MSRIVFTGMMMHLIVTTGFAQPDAGGIGRIMQRHYADSTAPGAALWVYSDDSLITRCYGLANLQEQRPVNTHTHFRMASVSKQITALSIFHLIRDGRLEFDTRISEFFPGLQAAAGTITVAQLLQHTSGIWDYEALIPETQTRQVLDRDVLELVSPVGSTYFPPGRHFRYSNTGYCLLALIVSEVSGMPYAEYARKHLFGPLQMHSTLVYEEATQAEILERALGYHRLNDSWEMADQSLTSATQGDGGVYTSIEDYGQWVRALFGDADWVADYWNILNSQAVPVGNNIAYSMGWFLSRDDSGNPVLFHSGESTGFHNIVFLDKDHSKAAVLFTNRDDMEIASAFQEVLSALDISIPSTRINGKICTLFEWMNEIY